MNGNLYSTIKGDTRGDRTMSMYVIDAIRIVLSSLKGDEVMNLASSQVAEAIKVLNHANISQEDIRCILNSKKFSNSIVQSYIMSGQIGELMMNNSTVLMSKADTVPHLLACEFMRWCRGNLDPCQLVNLLDTALSRQDVSDCRLLDQILFAGGHLSNVTSVHPISFQCSKLSYQSITALSTINTACLASMANATAILSKISPISPTSESGSECFTDDGHKFEERYYFHEVTGMKTSLNPLVNYCTVHGSDDLLSSNTGMALM